MSAPSTSGLSFGLLLRVIDVKYGCLLYFRFLHYYNRYYLFKLTVLLNNTGHILQGSTIVKLVAFGFFSPCFCIVLYQRKWLESRSNMP